jgi:predicted NAD/FAD-binding protein
LPAFHRARTEDGGHASCFRPRFLQALAGVFLLERHAAEDPDHRRIAAQTRKSWYSTNRCPAWTSPPLSFSANCWRTSRARASWCSAVRYELAFVENVCADVVILDHGKVVASGALDEVRRLRRMPSLEAVFSDLVAAENVERTAANILELMEA